MISSNTSILLGGSFDEHHSQFEEKVINLGYSQQKEQLPPYYGYLQKCFMII